EGRRHPTDHRVLDPPLHLRNDVPGIALEPMSIEGLGHEAKLDDEIVAEVLRLGLAAFLAPQAQQGSLIAPHDHPGVGAADKAPAIKTFGGNPCALEREGHDALQKGIFSFFRYILLALGGSIHSGPKTRAEILFR